PFDELLGDREPQARAAEAPRHAVLAAPEALEDRLAQGHGHAGAVVRDGEDRVVALRAQRDAYTAAVRRELHRVPEQVQQHALDLGGIGAERYRLRRLDRQLDVAFPCHSLEERGRTAHDLREIEPRAIELDAAGLDLGDVQKIAHVLEQSLRIALDRLEVA